MATPPSMSSLQAAGNDGLLAADATEGGPSSRYTMRDLPASTTWPSGSRAGAVDMSRSCALLRGPDRRCEVLLERQRRRELEHRVAVVVGLADEYTEPLPASTQMLPLASTTGAAPPIQMAPWLSPAAESTVKTSRRAAGLGHRDHPAAVGGAVAVVAAHAEDHAAGVERQPGALQQRGGVDAGRVDVLGELHLAGGGVETDQPCAGVPLTSSSATTKISERAGRSPASR